MAALIDRATREFGGLDLVFNVAGPWLNGDPLAHWSRIVSANLLGTMHVTRQAIEVLKRRGGAIVNVAADAGLGFGAEERPAYCAAKAGIVRLTAALCSLKEQKIRVNCIAPDVIGEVEDFAAVAVVPGAARGLRRPRGAVSHRSSAVRARGLSAIPVIARHSRC